MVRTAKSAPYLGNVGQGCHGIFPAILILPPRALKGLRIRRAVPHAQRELIGVVDHAFRANDGDTKGHSVTPIRSAIQPSNCSI